MTKLGIDLRHWAWAIPVILIVAALSIAQFDLYLPAYDEFRSMMNAGLITQGPYSPLEIIQSVQKNAADHMPGYFLLLSAWGNSISGDEAILRALGIFAGLLALAVAYRLARDLIDPIAGLIMIVLVACNAYYNYEYDHIRMYSCIVLASGIALWFYLRFTYHSRNIGVGAWCAFSISVFALVMLHAMSAFLFLSMLCGYHVAFVKKNRRWFAIPVAIACVILICAPFLLVVATEGFSKNIAILGPDSAPLGKVTLPVRTLRDGLALIFNTSYGLGQLALLSLPIAGIILSLSATKTRQATARLTIFALMGFGVILTGASVGLIPDSRLRYGFSLLLPFFLFLSAGLFAWVRLRSWALFAVSLYVIASLLHHDSGNSDLNVGFGRPRAIEDAPIHAISRQALKADVKPLIIGYQQSPTWIDLLLGYDGYSYHHHYFAQHGIELELIFDSREAQQYIEPSTTPAVWAVYQESAVPSDINLLDTLLQDKGYRLCQRSQAGKDAAIRQYLLQTLPCGP